jgi:alpha-amylase/alpha-mannosidase (GH57 family)
LARTCSQLDSRKRPKSWVNPTSVHDCGSIAVADIMLIMSDQSTAAERYICIHGHFYQPPRENPWLETVETEDSAAPYHDWNERITAECYAPNGASRIVNGENQIIRIMNNYSRISFNFGPTLLSWLEENAPRTYRMIRDADRQSMLRYDGHGSALAQVYNHVIMPLAITRDRVTQIRWGIADFEHRFGRPPEGMWLAETAVDIETLDLLAQNGILFTILAPHQCARVRERAETNPVLEKLDGAVARWIETPDASVNPNHPYLVRLKEGRSIAVFFYNGPISRSIAFEGVLNNGENFAWRLARGVDPGNPEPQVVHVATDGESYGHHHRHGEMALSYALRYIEDKKLAQLTNYGQFLALFPPKWEAKIVEDTSWSCAHGIERWRSDCGCNGGHQGWNQRWRAPLRAALDWLRDTVTPLSESAVSGLLKDVWAARDAYISVILAAGTDKAEEAIDRFFAAHAQRKLSSEERTLVLKMMEMQRHLQLMYTSCGWFFDDISGIETVQVVAYAARALRLAADIFGLNCALLEWQFVERLRQAKCNHPQWKDGGDIYKRLVKPQEVDLEHVAAHYAISSVFGSYPDETVLFCYTVRRLDYQNVTSGRAHLAIGRCRITSNLTEQSEEVSFAALHFGDHNVTAAVERSTPKDFSAFQDLKRACSAAVTQANLPEVVRLIDSFFGGSPYSLASLFKDDQRRILRFILNATLSEVEDSLVKIYEEHASLLHFLNASGLPKPPALTMAAGFAINAGLRRALEEEPIDLTKVRSLISLAKSDGVVLESHALRYLTDQHMKRSMVQLQAKPVEQDNLEHALSLARALRELPFELNLWQAQNIWYDTLTKSNRFLLGLEASAAEAWRANFLELGRQLSIAVEQLVVEEGSLAGQGMNASSEPESLALKAMAP